MYIRDKEDGVTTHQIIICVQNILYTYLPMGLIMVPLCNINQTRDEVKYAQYYTIMSTRIALKNLLSILKSKGQFIF